jgi:hypothetical protein
MQVFCSVRVQMRTSLKNFTGNQVKGNLALALSYEPRLSRYRLVVFNRASVAKCTLTAVVEYDSAVMCL